MLSPSTLHTCIIYGLCFSLFTEIHTHLKLYHTLLMVNNIESRKCDHCWTSCFRLRNRAVSIPLYEYISDRQAVDKKMSLLNAFGLSEFYTGLFISPSGISELDCAATKTDTSERIISIGRESLQVFFCTRGLGVLPGSTARG